MSQPAFSDPWTAAREIYMKDLSPAERRTFETATLDNLVQGVDDAQKHHQETSKSRKLSAKLEPFVSAIDQYSKALDVYSNTYGLATAPIWGSIRVLLQIASAFSKYFEKLIGMLERIGDVLPRCHMYHTLFPTRQTLLAAISRAYLDVILFCTNAKEVFRKLGKSTTLHLTWKLIWKDFDKEFENSLCTFRQHIKTVEKEAGLSNMIEASKERDLVRVEREAKRRRHLLSCLSSINYHSKHLEMRAKRHPGTCVWMNGNSDFKNWETSEKSDCFWLYGIPGSGKSVLMSHIVDHLADYHLKVDVTIQQLQNDNGSYQGPQASKTAITFYYYESSTQASLSTQSLLGTLLQQLLDKIDIPEDIAAQIEKFYAPPRRKATDSEVMEILTSTLRHFSIVYILIDGVDECESDEIKSAVSSINQLMELDQSIIKILISSREHHVISTATKDYRQLQISEGRTSQDIELFVKETVKAKLASGELNIEDSSFEEEIVRALTKASSGMFLLVHFQLIGLCDVSSEFEIRQALLDLPNDIKEVYRRILSRISKSKANSKMAKTIFTWVLGAVRPLHLNELAEAVAFEASDTKWDASKIPRKEYVYQACRNLVVLNKDDGTVSFVHHTFRQYLRQNSSDESTRSFHTSLEWANRSIGKLCVAYLSFSDFEQQLITTDRPSIMLRSLPSPSTVLDQSTQQLGLNFSSSKIFKLRRYFHGGENLGTFPNFDVSKFVSLKKLPSAEIMEQYALLEYVIANWLSHTKDLENNYLTINTLEKVNIWREFQSLATTKPMPFDIRPWDSLRSDYYSGMADWAVSFQHLALFSLVPLSYRVPDRLLHEAISGGNAKVVVEVIQRSTNIETPSHRNFSPLLESVSQGHEPVVELLVRYGANIEAKDGSIGRTALYLAVLKGREQSFLLLLEKGADINAKDNEGSTVLHCAAFKGRRAMLEILLNRGAQIEETDKEGRAALYYAAYSGQEGTTRLLLARGADRERIDTEGKATPLIAAASSGYSGTVKVLLDHGADIHVSDKKGSSAHHKAAANGDAKTLELLLNEGAAIESQDYERSTALMIAASKGFIEAVRVLIEKGAKVDGAELNKTTALILSASGGFPDVVRLLLKHNARPNRQDTEGYTALIAAAKNGWAKVIEILLENGASTYMTAKEMTATHWAAKEGHVAALNQLLGNGAATEAKDVNGRTPLHHAAENGHEGAVEELLVWNPHIHARDKRGKSPLDLATAKGHHGVMSIINAQLESRKPIVL